MCNGERVCGRRKACQNAYNFVVFLDRRYYHGAYSEGANGCGIHARVGFRVVAAELFSALDAQPRKAAFHAEYCAWLRSGGPALGPADDFVSIAFAQGDGCS